MSFLPCRFHREGVVSVTSRSPIERQVPATELERFDHYCAGRPVSVHEAASQAVLEFLPRGFVPDGYRTDEHAAEEKLTAVLRDADLLGDSSLKQTGLEENRRDALTEQDREKCRVHVDDPLQEALKKFVVSAEGKARGEVGVYFAEALREFRNGGQGGRIREWIDRLTDHMNLLPADRETRTEKIVADVESLLDERGQEYVHRRTIDGVVQEHTDAEVDTAIREYRQDALDELGFVPVSTGREVYAPPAVAEKLEADHAMEEIGAAQYNNLGRKGRVAHLRAALRQRAEASGGAAALTYTDVMKKVFASADGPSTDYAYTLMECAADASGFRYDKYNGQKRLRFSERWVDDADSTGDAEDTAADSTSGAEDADTAADTRPADGWVADAAAAVPDDLGADAPVAVIKNKIARARDPSLGEDDAVPADALDAVDADDCERVRAHLRDADTDTADDSTADSAGDPTAGDSTGGDDDAAEDAADSAAVNPGSDGDKPPSDEAVDDRLDVLEKAVPTATDGGQSVDPEADTEVDADAAEDSPGDADADELEADAGGDTPPT